jgi:hypothetical protein
VLGEAHLDAPIVALGCLQEQIPNQNSFRIGKHGKWYQQQLSMMGLQRWTVVARSTTPKNGTRNNLA